MPTSRVIKLLAVLLLLGPLAYAGGQEVQPDNVAKATNDPSISLPFEFSNKLIAISILVNGQPARFLLDTALSDALISKELSDRLSLLTVETEVKVTGLRSTAKQVVPIAKNVRFDVSGAVLADGESIVSVFSSIPLLQSMRIDGILGSALFLKHTITIDYSHQRIRIDDPSVPANEDLVLEFDPRKLPLVSAQLERANGQFVTEKFLIDTGSDGEVELNSWCAKKYRKSLSRLSAASGAYEVGIDGSLPDEEGSLKGFRFEGRNFKDIAVTISAPAHGAAGRGLGGKIGNSFLSRFSTMTVDYSRGRLILRP